MARLACFSTSAIAPGDRLARWDAALWNQVVPARTLSNGGLFDGDARHARLGSIHLFSIVASAHRFESAGTIGHAEHNDLALLVVQSIGAAIVAQGGREIALAAGAWAICDADRPFSITSALEGKQMLLLIPRGRLGGSACLPNHLVRDYGAAGGTARLLPSYVAGLFDEIGVIADSNCDELADVAAQLVRLSLLEARHATPSISMRETLRLRVKDYVRRNLRDPALTIERVAAAFGCTKRHLHKVFSGDEDTLSRFIWTQRLESCREALRNPLLSRHSITEIAFMWGFNNSAHFSKSFKERFGIPPGSVRRSAGAANSRPVRLQAAA